MDKMNKAASSQTSKQLSKKF